MDRELLQAELLTALQRRVPERPKLVNILMEILLLEREAVYRRLRGEVPFTFAEVVTITRKFYLSLDEIIQMGGSKSRPFVSHDIHYNNPLEFAYSMMKQMTRLMRLVRSYPGITGGEATKSIPQPLYLTYEKISQFFLFKWLYQYDPEVRQPVTFSSTHIPPALRAAQLDNVRYARHVETIYILDYQLFDYLKRDIAYFEEIRIITREEIELLKNDLLALLDEMEELAERGSFSETGKKIQFYVSNVTFDNSYCYIKTPIMNLSLIKAYTINVIASFDEPTFQTVQKHIRSLMKSSILISESNMMERIAYFDKQRELVKSI
ncbi:MAG: hypothetical protein LUD74_03410 [Tannerellaceae bacterium]|nr:hypothetical protein [Tannerellaceae bacterium]